MLKKVLLTGVTVAAVAGTGTAAIAATGSSSSTPSASPSSAAAAGSTAAGTKAKAAAAKHPGLAKLRNLQHGSWVTEDRKTKTFTTHEAIKGSVGSVSATSITVTSDDKTSQTYVVTAATKVHTRAQHQGAAIADVKVGDTVVVTGTGTTSFTATQVVDATK